MDNRRCSDPPAHGRANLPARPSAPPLTQLQVDAIRDMLYELVDDYPRSALDDWTSFQHGVWCAFWVISQRMEVQRSGVTRALSDRVIAELRADRLDTPADD